MKGNTTSHFISSSKDQTVRIWKNNSEPIVTHIGVGHMASVISLTMTPKEYDEKSIQFCSGGFDGSIYLWDISKGILDKSEIQNQHHVVPQIKKLKKDETLNGYFKPILQFNSSSTSEVARAHSQAVSGLERNSDFFVYSSSWDHSVKQWDASTGLCISTLVTNSFYIYLDIFNILVWTFCDTIYET